jgi:type I restriction enzyme, S subunit
MHEGWAEVPLGEICSIESRLVDPTTEQYRDLPHLGVERLESATGRLLPYRTAREDGVTSGKFLFTPEDVVLSKIRPNLRKAAWPGFTGLASADSYPLRPYQGTLPGYLLAVLLSDVFISQAVARSGRTKMPKINRTELFSIRVPLPPPEKQRRIVDLVTTAGNVVDGARTLASTSRQVLSTLQSDWRNSYGGQMIRLGDLADMASGPSWKAADERSTPQPGDVRVLGITNTPYEAEVDLTDAKYVGGLPASTRLLAPGALLMIRTNGNRARIGNVYRIPSEAYGLAYSAFQIGIHMRDARNADFTYWMLRNPTLQQTITDNASGTTGLGNIAVRWLKQLELPWPEADERRALVQMFDAIETTATAAHNEEHAGCLLRSSLLSDLLCGTHDIPDTYDALLETA